MAQEEKESTRLTRRVYAFSADQLKSGLFHQSLQVQLEGDLLEELTSLLRMIEKDSSHGRLYRIIVTYETISSPIFKRSGT